MGMRRARRHGTTAVATLAALLMLAACGSGGGDDSGAAGTAADAEAPAREGAAVAPGEAAAPGNAQGGAGAATDTRVDKRSIIYTGSIRVQVNDVDVAARDAVAAATRAGGFVGGDQRRSSDADAVADLELRVPAERFYAVVEELAGLGTQERREIGTQDVTEETIDLDARIASQRARVESARRLLAQANSISDLVSIENELARREADLASLEAKKRRLSDLTALSTITVTLVGPGVTTPEEETEIGFLVGLKGGWQVFLSSMTVLLTVLGAILPWLLVFGVPLGALWWLARRRRRNRPGVPALVAPSGTPPPPGVSAPPPVPGARSAP
ncbi:DUF4349 domain-containing protein [Verrucosispora sp. WMMD703]|uniref:DUF4349 domain-containing protein n=1 Tax=Micromonospora TaxID=1873 RepID=UPI0008E3A619|nr:DUF4349 domain-containing protein [Micromonospora sediminimaris]SFD10641.1 protein of unknown function [Micromonospora sediminimaris]